MDNHLPLPAKISVSGVSYRQGVVALLKVGESVFVKRDPSNPYDSNACKVISTNGEDLGFVPKNVAPRLSSRPERFWYGKVVEVFKGDLVGVRILISESEFEGVGVEGINKESSLKGVLESSSDQGKALESNDAKVLVDGREFLIGGEVFWVNGVFIGKLLSIDGCLARVLKGKGEYIYPLEFIKTA